MRQTCDGAGKDPRHMASIAADRAPVSCTMGGCQWFVP